MKLRNIGSNRTEIHLPDGTRVFFSCGTPVAVMAPNRLFYKTRKKHSQPTTRHINEWLGGNAAEFVSQTAIDALVTVKNARLEGDVTQLRESA